MLNKRNILIVDDEPRTREGLKRILDMWGNGEIQTFVASNADEALDVLRSKQVHILFTDIRMPQVSGIELLKILKEQNINPVVILISAYSEFEYAQEAIRLGALDYLVKPISKKDLIQVVEMSLQEVEKRERAGRIEKVIDLKLVDVTSNHASNPATIKRALDFINSNLKSDLSQKEVANHVHLNPSYLSVLFKDNVGVTFSEYVTRQRMQKAKELLLSSDLSINEIAEESGYKTAKYFIKIFKEIEGVTPSSYRKFSDVRAF